MPLRGARHEADDHIAVEFAQQISQKGGLSGADFAGNDCKTGVVHHAEFKHGKGQAMIMTPIDQFWIGEDRERLLSQPEVSLVHIYEPSATGRTIRVAAAISPPTSPM